MQASGANPTPNPDTRKLITFTWFTGRTFASPDLLVLAWEESELLLMPKRRGV